ncbi:tetratricopeptide repeat protein [Pelagibius sp.]|uniref:tetratricopeptide repeat protein n=1 Tax=Pelagibius sp. TaxID=1931238 RepID=UPI003BB1689E
MTSLRYRSLTSLCLALMAGAGLTLAAVQLDSWKVDSARNAPVDPVVTEALGQARGLQKLGRWDEAAVIFERYAQQGHPTAMFHAAKVYSRGWGVAPDLEHARQMLLRAVQYQFAHRGEAAFELGRLYQRSAGPDCNRIAVEWFLRALDWNYRKAHVQLAMHYERGLGVEQNVDRAVTHYRAAAEAGYETASIRFARALFKGRFGMTPDPQRAQRLAERAIEALKRKAAEGSGSAAKTLGRLYRDGEFVEADRKLALRWLKRAGHLGDAGGMHDLARLMLAIPAAGDAEAEDKAQEALTWLRRAAGMGHGGAMTALGRLHLKEDHGLPRSAAVGWFKKGVEVGHGGSMEELARLCAEGELTPRDLPAAITLARRGASLGHRGSQSLLEELLAMEANGRSRG